MVAVEWYEGGETKGKELECDVILQLNPELRKPLSSRSVNSRSAAVKERSASASSRKGDRRTICTPAKVWFWGHAHTRLHPSPAHHNVRHSSCKISVASTVNRARPCPLDYPVLDTVQVMQPIHTLELYTLPIFLARSGARGAAGSGPTHSQTAPEQKWLA